MKLNMWMIANRLGSYDIEMNLDPAVPAGLNSALPVYIPGCVRISAAGNDVLCEHDRDYIRIRDLSLSDGYMLIQGIFDWYQDWMDRMDGAIMRGQFRLLAQECSRGFDNPVMLQDSNYRLLGMAGQFAEGDMPPEWNYISQNGQSSVDGYSFMANALNHSVGRYRQHVRRFAGRRNGLVPYGGLHASITFHGREYGKLTVLEYNRAMNQGDICLMEYLSRRMSIYNAASSGFSKKFLDTQTLEALIAGQEVEADRVRYLQSIMENNQPGQFAVQTLQFTDPNRTGDLNALQLLKNLIQNQYTDTAGCIRPDSLVLLLFSPTPDALARQVLQFTEASGYRGQLRSGVSLPYSNLEETGAFHRQAANALRHTQKPELVDFRILAKMFLLNASGRERLLACEPIMRRIWDTEPDKRSLLQSLGVYLDMERSCTLAAEKLFIHKNTLTYRMRSLREQTGWDLDDAYLRDYLRLSLYCLEQDGGGPPVT